MAILTRSRVTEGFLGAGSLGVLLASMAAIDDTVRKEVAAVLSGDSGNSLSMASASLQQTVNSAVKIALEYTDMNTPLVFFACVAVVLFFLMTQG